MLRLQESWVKRADGILVKEGQFSDADFLGPFVDFEFLKEPDGKKITVVPKKSYCETVKYSKSQFELLVLAGKEIFDEFGEFTLKLPEIGEQVVIKSTEEVKETIYSVLKNMKLF